MRILVATSRLAEPIIRDIVRDIMNRFQSDLDKIDVIVSRIPVAALMSSKDLEELLRELGDKIREYDLIITPGLLIGDIEPVCRRYNVKCFKGSRFAGDLPKVIEWVLEGKELSTTKPADELVEIDLGRDVRNTFLERSIEAFRLRNLKIPVKPPPILVASEVVVKGDLDKDLRVVKRVLDNGCDILVIGTEVLSDKPDYIRTLFKKLYKETDKPIAIDSLNIREIEEAVSENASLVMNLSRSFEHWIDRLLSMNQDLAFVIVPEDVGSGEASERAEACVRDYKYFSKKGLRKVILDPVTPLPLFGSLEGIYAVAILKRRLEKIPLMIGAGNIYEMIDGDPVGSISLLTIFSFEAGASIILITEESWKSREATLYARKSSELVARAYARKSPPIDLGIDLYVAKSKKGPDYLEIPFDIEIEVNEKIPPRSIEESRFFVVQPDYERRLIEVYVFIGSRERAVYRLVGRDPRSLGRKALRIANIDDPEHAFYLGLELARAYEALRTGRTYVQDEELRLS
ncbi:MAG: dihydropteroate synthase-like protein [Sulfolobales archaeon]